MVGLRQISDAIALVGDGDGKIDIRLHASLINQEATPFQTHFGIKILVLKSTRLYWQGFSPS
jgi:hypothetical protein